jgi:hypothetical protein
MQNLTATLRKLSTPHRRQANVYPFIEITKSPGFQEEALYGDLYMIRHAIISSPLTHIP